MSNVYVPQEGQGHMYPLYLPPFYGSGNWNNTIGMGKKTGKGKKKSHGKGLLLGKNSPFNAIPILGDIL